MFRTSSVRRSLLTTVSFFAIVSAAGTSYAQDGAAVREGTSSDEVLHLDPIMVTARKRIEDPQEVPISMTVKGADELDKSGIRSTGDLIRVAPNLSVMDTGIPKTSSFIIRGGGAMGMDSPTDTSVGVSIDGVPVPRQLVNMGFMDIEHIEVLRGPQGTLFGQGSSSGAINISSVQPHDEFAADISAEYGTDVFRDIRFSVNAPIVKDKVFARFSGYQRGQSGWMRDLNRGKEIGAENEWAGKGTIRFLPNEDSDVTISFDAMTGWSNNPSFIWMDNSDYPESSRRSPDKASRDTFGLSLTANYHFESLTFTSVTGLRRLNETTDTDNVDLLLNPMSGLFMTSTSHHSERNDTLFQELRISSPESSAIKWQTGVNFSALNYKGRFSDFSDMVGFGSSEEYRNPYIKDRSYAAFAEATIPVMEKFFLTVGGRYTYDKKTLSYKYANSYGYGVGQNASDSWDDLSGRISFGYRPDDDLTLYATVSRGWKPGGYNAYATNIAYTGNLDDAYGETKSISYEIGVKKRFLDGRAFVNAALFYNDISDEQVGNWEIDLLTGITTYSVLNADVISRGGELEAGYQVTPSLLLRGGIGYTDARFNGSVAALDIKNDSRVPLVPEFTGNVGLTYNHDIGPVIGRNTVWSTSVDYSFNSQRASSSRESSNFSLPGYGIVNIRSGIEIGDFSVFAFARNLFDEEYYSAGGGYSLDGRRSVSTGQRRIIGLGVSCKW